MGFEKPTPIQEKAIPVILDNRDLIACAQTGTGKTAAFLLPVINKIIKAHTDTVDTLIIVPTRELAIQIEESFRAYGKYVGLRHLVIFGGVPQHSQVQALQRGVDILVATPGRLLDLMEHATQRPFVYSHAWRSGDLVIWDNLATMHRGTRFDDKKYHRELRRVTTLDIPLPATA